MSRFLLFSMLFTGVISVLTSCDKKEILSVNYDSRIPFMRSNNSGSVIPIDSNFVPAAETCTWNNNKKAAYTIAFDDARPSHYQISGVELEKRDIVGTFNLNTKSITRWDSWERLFNEGNEIASHTWSHFKCTELSEEELRSELSQAYFDICYNIRGISEVPSFTYPYGLHNEFVRKIAMEYHLSARGGYGINNAAPGEEEFSMLKGVSIYPPYDINVLNNLVLEAIQKKGWIIVYFHSVSVKEETGKEILPLSMFKEHLDFICDMKDTLWIATQGQITKYIKLRETVHITSKIIDNNIIEVILSDSELFYSNNVKISFILNIPLNWVGYQIVVQNKNLNVSEIIFARENTVLYSILPGTVLTFLCLNKKI